MHETQQFIDNLKARDEQAFKRLLKEYHLPLRRLAVQFVGEDNADDIMQQVWLAVFKAIPGFKQQSSLKTWLYRIVANTSISKLRQAKHNPLDLVESEKPMEEDAYKQAFKADGHWSKAPISWQFSKPEDIIANEELAARLEQTIQALPEQKRLVITMYDIEGISSEDVCNILQISASNFRVLLHRARMELYLVVEKYQGEEK